MSDASGEKPITKEDLEARLKDLETRLKAVPEESKDQVADVPSIPKEEEETRQAASSLSEILALNITFNDKGEVEQKGSEKLEFPSKKPNWPNSVPIHDKKPNPSSKPKAKKGGK
jgi:hypothetical protein